MRYSRAFPLLAFLLTILPSGSVPAAERRDIPRPGAAVTVSGEIASPGRYALAPGERVSDLLRKCGGYTAGAFLPGAVLIRRSEIERRQGELSEWKARLKAVGHPLAAWVGAQEATGRMLVVLDHPRLMEGTPSDILLEDGDLLVVPPVPESVRVAGAVLRPSDVPFASGEGGDYYIRRAGRATADGDTGRTLIRKVDGRIMRLHGDRLAWSGERHRWEIAPWGDPPPTIEAGDLLYVPVAASCGTALPDGTPGTDVLRALLTIVSEPPPPICRKAVDPGGRTVP